MKKRILTILGLVLIAIFTFSGAALAADPTTVDVTWSGSGHVATDIDTGDALAGFSTIGEVVSGSYSSTETPNTAYPYMGVDSFAAKFQGHVVNGFMNTGSLRTDSYGSYGPAGQNSYSFVEVADGWADMAYRTTTNFASLKDCCYTHQLLGGHNVVLDAASYEIDRYIDNGGGESGQFWALGGGSATMDCMNGGASGDSSISLGSGCGCYTDANFNATGTGYVEVTGTGDNSVALMGNSIGNGTLQFIANWAGSISMPDWHVTAN